MHVVLGILLLAAAVVAVFLNRRGLSEEARRNWSMEDARVAVTFTVPALIEFMNLWSVWPVGEWIMIAGCALALVGLALYRWLLPDYLGGLILTAVGVLITAVGPAAAAAVYVTRHLYWN